VAAICAENAVARAACTDAFACHTGRMRKLVGVDPTALGIVLAVVIGGLALGGALNIKYDAAPAFDLDSEFRVPAFVGALLLVAAAIAAWLAASTEPRGSWPWLVLAGLFVVMGVDEAAGTHEALEDLTGVDFQTLYLPLMAIAGVAWLAALRRVRRIPLAAVLLALGAAAWAGAQVLEAVQWSGPRESEVAVDGYGILMGIEEVLEMCGSAAFALGPLIAARAWAAATRPSVAAAAPGSRVEAGR
jgi:hypothetical protein